MKTISQDNKITNKVCYSIIIGFVLVIILIWMNEIFDFPHILFKAPATPVNITESVIESIGYPVKLVEGNPENIKITTPEDLVFAEAVFDYYKQKSGFF